MAKQADGTGPEVDYTAQLLALVQEANRGEEGALARLREFLDSHPAVWATVGDLAKIAERSWIELLVAREALATESVTRYVDTLRSDLLGPQPTRMERVLVDEVVAAYLAARHADIAATQPGSCSVALAGLRYRRCESAQRRHQLALKNLAILRAKLPGGLAPPGAGSAAAAETAGPSNRRLPVKRPTGR